MHLSFAAAASALAVAVVGGTDDGRPIEVSVKPLGADGEEKVISTAPRAVVGRLKVTRKLLASIARATDIDIGAPNDMDEAWHVGRAEPLRRVAQSCPSR